MEYTKTLSIYKIFAIVILLILFKPFLALASITPKVSITKLVASGHLDKQIAYEAEVKDGKLLYKKEIYPGQHIVDIIGVDYRLEFYNVGEMGKGVLPLWRPEHGLAKLTLQYQLSPGMIAVEKKLPAQLQSPGETTRLQYEPAKEAPELAPVEYSFRFTGGPEGTFYELPPYRMGKAPQAQAQVIDGKEVKFLLLNDRPMKASVLPHHSYMPALKIETKDPFYGFEEGNVCGVSFETLSKIKTERTVMPFILGELALARDSGARFSDLSGQVIVYPISDPEDSRIAEMDDILKVGEAVHTEEDSSAIISFADMSTFVLCPESTIVFDTPPGRKSKIRMVAGKIWANIKRMIKDGSMDITMNQAVLGIKGTTFVLEDDGKSSTLKVIEGSISYRAKAGGGSVVVNGGEKISATKDGLGEKQPFDAVAEKAAWEDFRVKLSKHKQDATNTTSFGVKMTFVLFAVMLLSLFFILRKISRVFKKNEH